MSDYWEETRTFWYKVGDSPGQWHEHAVWWLDAHNIDYIGPTGAWVLKGENHGNGT
jgi:hypothetical protein